MAGINLFNENISYNHSTIPISISTILGDAQMNVPNFPSELGGLALWSAALGSRQFCSSSRSSSSLFAHTQLHHALPDLPLPIISTHSYHRHHLYILTGSSRINVIKTLSLRQPPLPSVPSCLPLPYPLPLSKVSLVSCAAFEHAVFSWIDLTDLFV